MEALSTAEHNQTIVDSHPCLQACICDLRICRNKCDNKYNYHCESYKGKFWHEDHDFGNPCRADHSKQVYKNGVSCHNVKCLNSRLETSSWCLQCLAAYKTSKGELLPEGEYRMLDRVELHNRKLASERARRVHMHADIRAIDQENLQKKRAAKEYSRTFNRIDLKLSIMF